MISFSQFTVETLGIARRLAGENGKRFLGVLVQVHEAITDGVEQAAWCGSPDHCPEDALVPLGWERGMVQGPSESNDSFRARIKGAWVAWEWAGTEYGLVSQLEAYGLTPVIIEARDLIQSDTNWSRFWVVLPAGGHPYVGTVPDDDQRTIRTIIRRWKPAHVVCEEVVVMLGGRLYGYPDDGLTYDQADAAGLTFGDSQPVRFAG